MPGLIAFTREAEADFSVPPLNRETTEDVSSSRCNVPSKKRHSEDVEVRYTGPEQL